MKIHEVLQKSEEWLRLRAGIVTASELDSLVTPKFEIRKGKTPESYLAKKVAEKWIGGPLPSFQSAQMDQGNILEEDAIPFFSLQFDVEIQRYGFCTTDDGRAGCSPDGVILKSERSPRDEGLEIKCPEMHTHVRYLLDNCVPDDYIAQVHGSMYVTGLDSWLFLSYRKHMPPLTIRVQRDEKFDSQIHKAISEFNERLDEAYAFVVKRNGGPPPVGAQFKPVEWEEDISMWPK